MSCIHHHFASAHLSYQLAKSQLHASLIEFERLVYMLKFIKEHLPPIHMIGPRFKDDEALKMFSGLSLEDLDNSITFSRNTGSSLLLCSCLFQPVLQRTQRLTRSSIMVRRPWTLVLTTLATIPRSTKLPSPLLWLWYILRPPSPRDHLRLRFFQVPRPPSRRALCASSQGFVGFFRLFLGFFAPVFGVYTYFYCLHLFPSTI